MSPSPTFTDDDIGKRVETAAGEPVGVVTMTEDETAYVDLEDGVADATRAALGWETDADEVVPVDAADVGDRRGDAIRLAEAASTPDEGTDPVIEREESTVHEDEGSERRAVGAKSRETETAGETAAEGEGRSGKGVEPETEEMEESGAERHPDSEENPPQGDRTVTEERGENEDR